MVAGDEAADRIELIELVGRHAQLTDDGEWETRVGLYTEDGEFTSLDGVLRRGRDELREAFSATAGRITGKHITSNTVLTLDGDRASGRTDYAFFMVTGDAIVPGSVGRYHDEFVKGSDGWRFRSRRIVPLTGGA
jgi:3-phenylpropionate/cinnamic acid dioxygenase small subunit